MHHGNKSEVCVISRADSGNISGGSFICGRTASVADIQRPVDETGRLKVGELPAWFGPVFGIDAIPLATPAFVVLWKQKSFLVSGLHVVSGIMYTTPVGIALANINFAVIMIPGSILGFISGLVIVGLCVTKGIRTANMMTTMVTVRK